MGEVIVRQIGQDATPNIRYILNYDLYDSGLTALSGPNWGTSKAIITQIFVTTDSTDWDLFIFSATDATSGILGSGFQIITRANGPKTINLQLPYIDHEGQDQVYLMFLDNTYIASQRVASVLGIKAR